MQDSPVYNAFERDIAVLNIFFGDSTVFGKWFGFFYRNKLFVGTKLIKNGTISMKVGTIGVR